MKRVLEEKIPTTLPTAAGKRAVAKTEWYHQAVVAPGFPADGKLLWVSSKWGDHAAPERHGCFFTALKAYLSGALVDEAEFFEEMEAKSDEDVMTELGYAVSQHVLYPKEGEAIKKLPPADRRRELLVVMLLDARDDEEDEGWREARMRWLGDEYNEDDYAADGAPVEGGEGEGAGAGAGEEDEEDEEGDEGNDDDEDEDGEIPEEILREQLTALSAKQLNLMCEEAEVPKGGTKAEVVARLLEAMQGGEEGEDDGEWGGGDEGEQGEA